MPIQPAASCQASAESCAPAGGRRRRGCGDGAGSGTVWRAAAFWAGFDVVAVFGMAGPSPKGPADGGAPGRGRALRACARGFAGAVPTSIAARRRAFCRRAGKPQNRPKPVQNTPAAGCFRRLPRQKRRICALRPKARRTAGFRRFGVQTPQRRAPLRQGAPGPDTNRPRQVPVLFSTASQFQIKTGRGKRVRFPRPGLVIFCRAPLRAGGPVWPASPVPAWPSGYRRHNGRRPAPHPAARPPAGSRPSGTPAERAG